MQVQCAMRPLPATIGVLITQEVTTVASWRTDERARPAGQIMLTSPEDNTDWPLFDPPREENARNEYICQWLLASGSYPFLAEPRSRYFSFARSPARFCWSTQAMEGKFFSWV
jgi:hypothetical protein